jgi:Mg/Co/Ni transporter MgtE
MALPLMYWWALAWFDTHTFEQAFRTWRSSNRALTPGELERVRWVARIGMTLMVGMLVALVMSLQGVMPP